MSHSRVSSICVAVLAAASVDASLHRPRRPPIRVERLGIRDASVLAVKPPVSSSSAGIFRSSIRGTRGPHRRPRSAGTPRRERTSCERRLEVREPQAHLQLVAELGAEDRADHDAGPLLRQRLLVVARVAGGAWSAASSSIHCSIAPVWILFRRNLVLLPVELVVAAETAAREPIDQSRRSSPGRVADVPVPLLRRRIGPLIPRPRPARPTAARSSARRLKARGR